MENTHLIIVVVLILLLFCMSLMNKGNKHKKHNNKVKEAFVNNLYSNDNNTFALSNWKESDEIVENFPQTSPMNLLYSDPSGNLGSSNDVGIKNVTITQDGALLLGNKFRLNANKDFYADDDWLRISNKENTTYYGGIAANKFWSQGEIISNLNTGSGQFRASHGDYGTIFRQDGDNFYILNTKKGDSYGGWNDLRPFYINNVSGDVGMAHNLSVTHNINAGGKIKEGGNELIPRGTIVMWNGSSAPAGWAICNGANGTPDLRGRFIVGTGDGYNLSQTGGAASVTLSVEQIPSHSHALNNNWTLKNGSASGAADSWLDLGGWHNGRYISDVSIAATGGGQPHENLPPILCVMLHYEIIIFLIRKIKKFTNS
jgi:microcystin-dependent protein